MYKIYLGNVIFPIAPSNIETKISNKNKTTVLINESEINFLRSPGLTNIKFDLLLPNVKYPFAEYESGFKDAYYYLDYIKKLKINKKPFMFRIGRYLPTGKMYSDRSMKVSLEEYTIKDDANNGFDIVVSLQLKQYRDFGTKIANVTFTARPAISDVKTPRETKKKPTSITICTYGKITTTQELAKLYYGDISVYTEIEKANPNIKNHYVPENTKVILPNINNRFDNY